MNTNKNKEKQCQLLHLLLKTLQIIQYTQSRNVFKIVFKIVFKV